MIDEVKFRVLLGSRRVGGKGREADVEYIAVRRNERRERYPFGWRRCWFKLRCAAQPADDWVLLNFAQRLDAAVTNAGSSGVKTFVRVPVASIQQVTLAFRGIVALTVVKNRQGHLARVKGSKSASQRTRDAGRKTPEGYLRHTLRHHFFSELLIRDTRSSPPRSQLTLGGELLGDACLSSRPVRKPSGGRVHPSRGR